MADQRKYPTGCRPSNKGGIEIRWKHNGTAHSEYLAETPNAAGLKRASGIRKERMLTQKMAYHYGVHTDTDSSTITLFAEAAQEYLNRADLEATTRGNYKNALNKYWMPALGEKPIAMITTKDIRQVMAGMTEISRKTQRNVIIPLRQVMKHAIDMEHISSDPAASISIRKGQKPQPDPFSLEEREAILSHLTGQEYFFYLMAFETGLRSPSEIIALNWRDFDGKTLDITKARVIRKLKLNTKTNEARKVLVTQRLRKELLKQKMKADAEWIFSNSHGGPCMDADLFNIAWRKALSAAGIRYRRAYNCRHTYASLGLKAGARPAFLASQLGHSLQMFYTTYAKWISEDDDIDELRRVEDYTQRNMQKVGEKVGEKPV